MAPQISIPITKADEIVSKCGSRDPAKIAQQNGILIKTVEWEEQSGAYIEMLRQPIIFVAQRLHPITRSIVIAHELGHHFLHRKEATQFGGFREFKIFDMKNSRMEYEANVFAAQLMLPDDETLEYIYQGYDVAEIASAMNSDINLVALKVSHLNNRGYNFREQEYRNRFY
jgi:Zn-dependent peptidase ImmA (M78 family)